MVLVMITLTAIGTDGAADAAEFGGVILRGVGLVAGVALLMRFVLPFLLPFVARSSELLVLFAVAYAVGVAAVTDWLEFSTEVGAFLAGFSLASTPYREAIGARLVSLRDFLLLFFFLDLGARLEFVDAGRQLTQAAVLSAFVLIGNPIIVMLIMGRMGYTSRVGFLAGLTVAQISEFSLILAALGLALGHIDSATVSLVTVVGLITIGLSTYMILYSHQLYERAARFVRIFERPQTRPVIEAEPEHVDVILFGLGRYGSQLARHLCNQGQRVLAVDFDPQAVTAWEGNGITALFGDAGDPEFLVSLPLERARWVLSAVPTLDTNLTLLHGLRHHGFRGKVALTAHNDADARRLESEGVDAVLQPFEAAADAADDLVLPADEREER